MKFGDGAEHLEKGHAAARGCIDRIAQGDEPDPTPLPVFDCLDELLQGARQAVEPARVVINERIGTQAIKIVGALQAGLIVR